MNCATHYIRLLLTNVGLSGVHFARREVDLFDETEPTDMALFERISAEIGDELLGSPRMLLRE